MTRGATVCRSLWQLPLWSHVLALFVVLMAGLWFTRPFVAYSSDEGAALLQARQLEQGQGWIYHSPIDSIDPEDQARPFVRGDKGSKGIAPYAKHPLYPVLLAGAERIGGAIGLGIMGAAATTLAGLMGALLVREVDARFDRVTLWLIGVGTPLFFDSYMVLAHGLAAGLAATALLLVIKLVRAERGFVPLSAGIVITVAASAMLRTEALFLGPSIALAAMVIAGLGRLSMRRALVVSMGAISGSIIAFAIDRVWFRAIIGHPEPGVPNAQASSWFRGRMDATLLTWFSPSAGRARWGDLLLVVAVGLLAYAGIVVHRGRKRVGEAAVLVVMAAACYVVRLAVIPVGRVPGLIIAFPAGWFMAWTLRRHLLRGVVMPMLLAASAVAMSAVVLTQYDIGGGIEWGGRYFAFVLPVLTAGLIVATAPMISGLGSRIVRVTVASLAVMSLTTASMGLILLRDAHVATASVLDRIATAAGTAGSNDTLGRPVVLSDNRLLPQIAFRDFDEYVWVVPDADRLPAYMSRLADLGVDRAVLAVEDADGTIDAVSGWKIVDREPGMPLDVVVVAVEKQ